MVSGTERRAFGAARNTQAWLPSVHGLNGVPGLSRVHTPSTKGDRRVGTVSHVLVWSCSALPVYAGSAQRRKG
jgi:hypothetical protein